MLLEGLDKILPIVLGCSTNTKELNAVTAYLHCLREELKALFATFVQMKSEIAEIRQDVSVINSKVVMANGLFIACWVIVVASLIIRCKALGVFVADKIVPHFRNRC